MLRCAINLSSILMLAVLSSATANAQIPGNGSTNSTSPTTSSGSTSSSGTGSSRSTSGSGTSANSNAGVNEFAINTENVQNAATGFVGSNASQSFVGGVRQSTNQAATGRQIGAFQNTQQTSSSQSSQSGTPRSIRTSLRIAFAAPSGTFAQQAGILAESNSVQLTQFTAARPELSAIDVNLTDEGIAILTGTSSSSETSRLAANLVRQQPGVRKINNQIVVVP